MRGSSRNLNKFSDKIANQIRSILHTHWPKEQQDSLKTLQKIAVAFKKSVEEKDDLEGIISSSAQELEQLSTGAEAIGRALLRS